MRTQILFAATVLAAGATALSFIGQEAEAAQGGKCLRIRDMTNLTKIDDRTLLAHTRTQTKYVVTLRHKCRDFGRPGNFYTLRLNNDFECFDRDDVLVFRDGGACFIENVTLKPAKQG